MFSAGDEATSSITANFRIEDARVARAFVDALCAEKGSRSKLPNVLESHFETASAERDFFANGPYGSRAKTR